MKLYGPFQVVKKILILGYRVAWWLVRAPHDAEVSVLNAVVPDLSSVPVDLYRMPSPPLLSPLQSTVQPLKDIQV